MKMFHKSITIGRIKKHQSITADRSNITIMDYHNTVDDDVNNNISCCTKVYYCSYLEYHCGIEPSLNNWSFFLSKLLGLYIVCLRPRVYKNGLFPLSLWTGNPLTRTNFTELTSKSNVTIESLVNTWLWSLIIRFR